MSDLQQEPHAFFNAANASLEEWQTFARQAGKEEIAQLILLLHPQKIELWAEKLFAFICSLPKRAQIEWAAKQLTVDQLICLLEQLKQKPDDNTIQAKAESLFIGLPATVFCALLEKQDFPSPLLTPWLHLEALLYHLTLFVHELEKRYEELNKQASQLYKELEFINLSHITSFELEEKKKIWQELAHTVSNQLTLADNVLPLTWKARRAELVESISHVKDEFSHLLRSIVKSKEDDSSTLFHDLIREKIEEIYTRSKGDLLSDQDPAIDALAKLSIWYPEELQAVGLICKDELAESPPHWEKIQKKLSEKGLHTVSDFKRAQIFSKESLRHFLSNL